MIFLLKVVRTTKLRRVKDMKVVLVAAKHLYGEVKRHNNEKLSRVSKGQRDI